jgi:1-acyl-sn-glycerol-3-phosphate acyltransferase
MNKFYSFLKFLLAWIFRLSFRLRVVNKQNQPKKGEGPFIVCANHISAMDPVMICVALKNVQTHYLAKESIFKNKIAAWFLLNLGMIPVTRSGNDVGALKTTLKNLDEGRSIGIFPQGTRHPGKDPRDTKLRGGLGMIQAHSGASILPIYIETKDNKVKFFRRITVILGEVITPEEIGKEGKGNVEYDRISNLVFDRICTLGEEYKKSLEAKK